MLAFVFSVNALAIGTPENDKKLNATYKAKPDYRKQLVESQMAWLNFVQSECKLDAVLLNTDAMRYHANFLLCTDRLTIARIEKLNNWIEY